MPNISGRTLYFVVLVALSASTAYAMGTPIRYWEPGSPPVTGKPLEVTPTVNQTGQTFELDVAGLFTERLRAALRERGLAQTSADEPAGEAIVVRAAVIAYEPGSAAQRWVWYGWGATFCTVRTTLVDKKTGETVGEVVIDKAVGSGGLYAVGADRWIIGAAADETVAEIVTKLGASGRQP